MRLKNNLQFNEDIDWTNEEVEPKEGFNTAWKMAAGNIDDEHLRSQLAQAMPAFDHLRYILSLKYSDVSRKEVNLQDPNAQLNLLTTAAYKRALQDIYNLIPKKVIVPTKE